MSMGFNYLAKMSAKCHFQQVSYVLLNLAQSQKYSDFYLYFLHLEPWTYTYVVDIILTLQMKKQFQNFMQCLLTLEQSSLRFQLQFTYFSMCPPYELMRPTCQYLYIHVMMAILCCEYIEVYLMVLPDEDKDGNELLSLGLRSLGPDCLVSK